MDCRRPKTGAVADSMRRTRAAYHYVIRATRKNADAITRQRFAEAVLGNRQRDFWSDVKCKKGVAATVDGYTDADSMAKLFATKYRDLYSCVSYSRYDLQSVMDDVGQRINVSSSEEHCSFSVGDVKRAIQQLKAQKMIRCRVCVQTMISTASMICWCTLCAYLMLLWFMEFCLRIVFKAL